MIYVVQLYGGTELVDFATFRDFYEARDFIATQKLLFARVSERVIPISFS